MIEMLVSIAILMIIAAVVLTSHASFTNSLIVTNAAYDISLSLRQAESFGISSRGSGGAANAGYGLHFTNRAPASSYTFFTDTSPAASCSTPDCKPGDGLYTQGSDGLVSTYTINAGISIVKLCGYLGAASYCSGSGHAYVLDVVFTRPNTSAQISLKKDGSCVPGGSGGRCTPLSSGCILLSSPDGSSQRAISVSAVGQVSPAASCP